MINNEVITFFCSVALGMFLIAIVIIVVNLIITAYQRICGTPSDKVLLKERSDQLACAKMLIESQKDKIKFLEKTLRKRNKEFTILEKEYERYKSIRNIDEI